LLYSISELNYEQVQDFGIEGSVLSDIEDVNGREPVRRTIMIPRAMRDMPREREKYSSRTE
jgi:hypothetical protein